MFTSTTYAAQPSGFAVAATQAYGLEEIIIVGVAILLLVSVIIAIVFILAGGFLLSARFSLIIAMAEIGVHLDLISKELEQQIILLAVITATFSPILFRLVRTQTK